MMNVQTRQVDGRRLGPDRGLDSCRTPTRPGRSGRRRRNQRRSSAAPCCAGWCRWTTPPPAPSAGGSSAHGWTPTGTGRSGAGRQGVDRLRRPDRGRAPATRTGSAGPGDYEAPGLATAHRHPCSRSIALLPTRASRGCADSCASVSAIWQAGKPVRQPDTFGLDAVPTYCQDTVFRWQGPDTPGEEDSARGRAADSRCRARLLPGCLRGSGRRQVREAAEPAFAE